MWKDSKRAKEAAGVMKLTARDLKKMGIVEHVIREEEPLMRENLEEIRDNLQLGIAGFLAEYVTMEPDQMTEKRYMRFRKF